MKRETLEIEILPDGRIQVEVKGRKGASCLEVRELLKELVGPVESTRFTDEYYETEPVVVLTDRVKGRSK